MADVLRVLLRCLLLGAIGGGLGAAAGAVQGVFRAFGTWPLAQGFAVPWLMWSLGPAALIVVLGRWLRPPGLPRLQELLEALACIGALATGMAIAVWRVPWPAVGASVLHPLHLPDTRLLAICGAAALSIWGVSRSLSGSARQAALLQRSHVLERIALYPDCIVIARVLSQVSLPLQHILWVHLAGPKDSTHRQMVLYTRTDRIIVPYQPQRDRPLLDELRNRCENAFIGFQPAFARMFSQLSPGQRAAAVQEVKKSLFPEDTCQKVLSRHRRRVTWRWVFATLVLGSVVILAVRSGLLHDVMPRPTQPVGNVSIPVQSTPGGAEVRLGDKVIGRTPCTVTAPAHSVQKLELNLSGRCRVTRFIVFKPGAPALDIRLESLRSVLLVHAWPPGTEVVVNGTSRGKSTDAAMVIEVPVGTVKMEFRKAGHVSETRHLEAQEGVTVPIDVQLAPAAVATRPVKPMPPPPPASLPRPPPPPPPMPPPPIVSNDRYAAIDERARTAPEFASIPDLADYLTADLKEPEEKARALYTWVATHIAYDVEGLMARDPGDQSAEHVFTTRIGVCAGYAYLFKALCEAVGLECHIVVGYPKDTDGTAAGVAAGLKHGWNAVRLRNRWGLVDTTFAAGSVDFKTRRFLAEFTPYYFLTPPEQFIYSHYPLEAEWQCLERPLSRAEFDALPAVKGSFFEAGLSLASHKNGLIETSDPTFSVTLNASTPSDLLARLDQNDKDIEGAALAQQDGSRVDILVAVPRPGRYHLTVYRKVSERSYRAVLRYEVSATAGTTEILPTVTSSFTENHGFIHEPLTGPLKPGRAQLFRLRLKRAAAVYVVQNGDWMPLTQNGDQYQGDIPLTRGTIDIVCKQNTSDTSGAVLLRYQCR